MSDDDKVVPIKRTKCPSCGKPSVLAYNPFCSKRCADVDLGKWLTGGYRLETEEEADLDELRSALEDGSAEEV